MSLSSVQSKEYTDVLRQVTAVVQQHQERLIPGAPQLNMCDLAVMAEAEMQEDAVSAGQKILIIDDLLATGGTLYAACELIKQQKAEVLGCLVVVELKYLNGSDKLKQTPVFSLIQY
ncbi:Adenine phosphoribosyltransferase [Anabarilius grahami]|uniref:adenine phosphoribosyltransferase n=1 Tax=Anabarilius grahami TaxID=495550 RepID=A0A3N0YJ49_ANAGA|nr:Adenine phosphoribosyltransferase [Anabarilius grahami]